MLAHHKVATYCAAKAYSQILAEALWCELKPRGIDVLSLVLGFTDTPARTRSGVSLAEVPGMPVLSSDDVAQQALDNLADGGPVYVPPPYARMFQSLCSAPRRQIAERMSGAAPGSQHKTT
jgi:short-subunit dehydrogenase